MAQRKEFLTNNTQILDYHLCKGVCRITNKKRMIQMNKAELIESMTKSSKLPKVACKSALEAFISAVSAALKQRKTVSLTGFGTFVTMKRKSRVGVNPATGKKMNIAAKTVPKFKPGKTLKDLVK